MAINHNTRRFPGSSKEDGEWNYDADTHRNYIFGGHVANYMRLLQENDEAAYKRQFSRYIAAGIGADDIEELYANAHAAIRADPNKPRGDDEFGRFKSKSDRKAGPHLAKRPRKLNAAARRNRVRQLIANAQSGGADEDQE